MVCSRIYFQIFNLSDMEKIDTPTKIRISSGINFCDLNSEGIVFHPEIEENQGRAAKRKMVDISGGEGKVIEGLEVGRTMKSTF